MVEIVGLGAWCTIKYSKKYFIRRIITRSAFISTLHSAESQCVIDFCFLGISGGSETWKVCYEQHLLVHGSSFLFLAHVYP